MLRDSPEGNGEEKELHLYCVVSSPAPLCSPFTPEMLLLLTSWRNSLCELKKKTQNTGIPPRCFTCFKAVLWHFPWRMFPAYKLKPIIEDMRCVKLSVFVSLWFLLSEPVTPQPLTCDADLFQCAYSFQCIPKSWLCDGELDCADHSDEEQCLTLVPGTLPPQDLCPAGYYQCSNNQCIASILRCDGVLDCPDGEDEYSCRKLAGGLWHVKYFTSWATTGLLHWSTNRHVHCWVWKLLMTPPQTCRWPS